MRLFAGLDWGGSRHAVCVVGDDGAIPLRHSSCPLCRLDKSAAECWCLGAS